MKSVGPAIATLLVATSAQAGGIDRSGQLLNPIFRDGTYAELSFGYTNPSLDGTDLVTGQPIKDVAGTFESVGFGFKTDITEKFSVSIIGAEDFGADVRYPGDPNRTALGGTTAITDGYSLTLLGRYKFDENWSVHGGIRANRQDATIRLNGLAYGPLRGYAVELDNDVGFGYVVGGAYEKKEIGLRIALTYNSRIRHDFDAQEFAGDRPVGPAQTVNTDFPQSVNLDFTTGVAPDWLLFGGVRWADFSGLLVEPDLFVALTGESLVDIEDTTTYTLGIAHRFTDAFAGSAAFIYEEPGTRVISPLSPTTGLQALQLGAQYTIDNVELSGLLRYSRLGDGIPGTGLPTRIPRGEFRDNSSLTAGIKVGVYF